MKKYQNNQTSLCCYERFSCNILKLHFENDVVFSSIFCIFCKIIVIHSTRAHTPHRLHHSILTDSTTSLTHKLHHATQYNFLDTTYVAKKITQSRSNKRLRPDRIFFDAKKWVPKRHWAAARDQPRRLIHDVINGTLKVND